jgi:hypothetical protein
LTFWLRSERVRPFVSGLKQLTAAEKWVVVLIGITSALAVGNLGKAAVALQYASNLPDLSMSAPLSYFAATGSCWGVVFILCTAGLSRFRDWGRWSTLAAVTLYQANVWINHLLFSASDYARQTILRNLALTAVLLLVFWISLSLPAVRRVFTDGDEPHGSPRLDNPRERQ